MRQPCGKHIEDRATPGTSLPEAALLGSLSVLLLLISMSAALPWLAFVVAQVPFVYQITRSSPALAACTGAVFGVGFFGLAQVDLVLAEPSYYASLIVVGTAACALFGWLTAWTRRLFGFNAIVISVLWVALELLLTKLEMVQSLGSGSLAHTAPFLNGMAAVLGSVMVSFSVVFTSSVIAAAIAIPRTLDQPGQLADDAAQCRFFYSHPNTRISSLAHLLPESRSPPSHSDWTSFCLKYENLMNQLMLSENHMFAKKTNLIWFVLVASVLMASTAAALLPSKSIHRKFKNNTNQVSTDLHIYFNGPVDAATEVTGYNPPFADIANAGSNVIELSGGTVAIGAETGCMKFSSNSDNLAIDSAIWTPQNEHLSLEDDISTCSQPAPSLTQYGMMALALLIVVSAVLTVRKRRKSVTTV